MIASCYIAFLNNLMYHSFEFNDHRYRGKTYMLQETGMLYKLTVLYTLHRVNYPISNNSLSNFLLQNDFTDYFNLQQLMGELIDDGYVKKEQYHGKTLYSISESGEVALGLLSRELSSSMKAEVDKYLSEHNMELKDDISVRSNYYQTGVSQFTANLFIEEAGSKLLELNVLTSTEDEAKTLCNKWLRSSSRLYPLIMTELMK